ncbi:TonB-dependent receptor [Hymenobacter sp. GOD-10R]|uniref:SusC/RagA family TonB-linked outer membrane protein n=1 Tax=Hymenobacter sp. GOD-10R TaxID=3093922 RepID=UPI002D77B7E2|nr:TonB-dependent receptor [Hymenobacter sp. GOD-10R]WRQ26367.1 TonB-dependent receptor [Hymenobacter sp. GOD-10R]
MKRNLTCCSGGSWARAASLTVCVLCLPPLASSASAQLLASTQQVARQPTTISLKQLLAQWETQYGASIGYDTDLIGDKVVVPRETDGSLDAKLKAVLSQVGLRFEKTRAKYYIVLPAKSSSAVPANVSVDLLSTANVSAKRDFPVSGRVMQSNGQPLPGVTVVVKGTTTVTSTDADGRFTLNVPPGSTLVISSVGFIRQEVPVTEASTALSIRLSEDTQALKEVVVVGYGTQSKRTVTTAISSVKGDQVANLPVTNPTQALVGQVSGVQLQQTSGAPGDPPAIRIRGAGSITSGNSPLYVIDGYPTNDGNLFNAISPQDIESIDILKDAASAAIYGSRAGNGVIIVTTKRGKSGKTTFSLNATAGVETVMHRYDLLNGQEFVDMAKEGLAYQNRPIPAFLNQPERWANTDWQDVIFRKAPFQNYQLSATGGSDKVRFSVSGGYIDQQGTLKNTFLKRYNLRASLDADLTSKVRVGVNLQPSYTQRRVQQTTGGNTSTGVDGILAEALTMPPILPVWRPNGDYFVITQDPEMKTIFNDELSNPLVKLDANKDFFYSFRQTGNAYLEYEPIEGLKLNSRMNVGLVSEREEWFVEPFLARGNGNTGNISTPNLAQIRARRNNTTNINWYWSNTATYDFSLHQDHNFTALLGYDVSRQNDFYVTLEPRTDRDNPVAFVNSSVKNVQGAVLNKGASERREYVFDAVFGRLNYNYKGRYLLSGSLRRDRSSRFGPTNRAGIFPSVSAGWNVSEESFLAENKAVSMLKIRASYGETGNDQLPGYYPWIATMQREAYNFGTTDAQVVAFRPSGFSNLDLGWEKNKQFDAGLDLGFLNDRIGLSVDLYNRNSNIILSADIPSINGKAASVIQNVGNVRNRGLEVTLNTLNIDGKLKWNTNFNISFNRNQIMSLASGQTQLANQGVVRNYVGRPMGDFYLYIVDGTFNNQNDVDTYPKLGSQGIGDLRYRDVSGPGGVPDGRITADDQVRAGNYQPDFVYGFGNTFTYSNFDLNILLDGSQGGEIYRSQELPLALGRWLENGSKQSLDRWRSESDPGNGKFHRAGTTNLSSDIASSTRYLYDASFLRIRNITLGYTLPTVLSEKIHVQRLRLYATGQNIYTFTKAGGFRNPQANGATTNGATDNPTNSGVDNGTYPISRNISMGLNLTF